MTTRDFMHAILEPTPIADTLVTGMLALPDETSPGVFRLYAWTKMPIDFGAECETENVMVARIVIERAALLEFVETTMRNLLSG